MDRDGYLEAVLSLVERVPPGRVTTYGAVADALGVGGPRQVGRVMGTHGGGVPWWRVVRADGSLPASHGADALEAYRAEGTPLTPAGRPRMIDAFWDPVTDPHPD